LYKQATLTAASDLVARIIKDAQPIGPATPNDAYGWGKLIVHPEGIGWQCDPAQGEVNVPCDTTCGSKGLTGCTNTCRWNVCKAPDETCNALDDNCDGKTDELWTCITGRTESCTTICLTEGTRLCSEQCEKGLCQPPEESCNGIDDDCDGVIDNGFACRQGGAGECATSCGSVGQRLCETECAWSVCQSPKESCNGIDDDCDGQTDEGFEKCHPAVDAGGLVATDAVGPANADGIVERKPSESSCRISTAAGPRVPMVVLLAVALFGLFARRRAQRTRT
jgi:hypothetical protein